LGVLEQIKSIHEHYEGIINTRESHK